MKPITLTPDQVTAEHSRLLANDVPVELRRTAVLTGQLPGKILTNDPHSPTWVAIWEAGDGTVYWGGALAEGSVQAVVSMLQPQGEVLIPFWTKDDPIVLHLPANPDFEGAAIDFLERDRAVRLDQIMAQLPDGLAVRPADLSLFERSFWYEDNMRLAGSPEAYLATTRAFYLMQGEEMLCEASTGPLIDGVREMGIITHEAHRGLGYATLTCAKLVQACESAGERPFWNCSTRNLASAAVARKLGFVNEKVFEFAWYEGPKAGE
jgi:GNAT superfamily N-acetyltransferase